MRKLLLGLVVMLAAGVRAEPPTSQPASFNGEPYRIMSYQSADPPKRIWILQVDLNNPKTKVRVSPAGPDPDADGPWQTTLMPASKVAEREGFDVAVNASFFSAKNTKDAEGKASGYKEGIWASAVGWTMTDGKRWSDGKDEWPVLWIDSSNRAHITSTKEVSKDAQQIVAGNAFVMKAGESLVPDKGMMIVRHPRTAVGVDKTGKLLTILTVDGRQPGKSVGMTGQEILDEMKKYDVTTAMNLDGGGSTTLVERDKSDGKLKVLNTPSDGRERAVADVIGVSVGK